MENSNVRILLVNDNGVQLNSIRLALLEAGFTNVICFYNPIPAKDYLFSLEIDILIVKTPMRFINRTELVEIAVSKQVNKIIVVSEAFGKNCPTKEEISNMGAVPLSGPFSISKFLEIMEL